MGWSSSRRRSRRVRAPNDPGRPGTPACVPRRENASIPREGTEHRGQLLATQSRADCSLVIVEQLLREARAHESLTSGVQRFRRLIAAWSAHGARRSAQRSRGAIRSTAYGTETAPLARTRTRRCRWDRTGPRAARSPSGVRSLPRHQGSPHRWGRQVEASTVTIPLPPNRCGGGERGTPGSGQEGADEAEDAASGLSLSGSGGRSTWTCWPA